MPINWFFGGLCLGAAFQALLDGRPFHEPLQAIMAATEVALGIANTVLGFKGDPLENLRKELEREASL